MTTPSCRFRSKRRPPRRGRRRRPSSQVRTPLRRRGPVKTNRKPGTTSTASQGSAAGSPVATVANGLSRVAGSTVSAAWLSMPVVASRAGKPVSSPEPVAARARGLVEATVQRQVERGEPDDHDRDDQHHREHARADDEDRGEREHDLRDLRDREQRDVLEEAAQDVEVPHQPRRAPGRAARGRSSRRRAGSAAGTAAAGTGTARPG